MTSAQFSGYFFPTGSMVPYRCCLQSSRQQPDPEDVLCEESLFLSCVFLYDLPSHIEGGAEDETCVLWRVLWSFLYSQEGLGKVSTPCAVKENCSMTTTFPNELRRISCYFILGIILKVPKEARKLHWISYRRF